MSAPPITVLTATPEEEAAIIAAVRAAPGRLVAGPEHVAGLLKLFSDPRVSDPIYDLPRPFSEASLASWVGLPGMRLLHEGELAGARRADLQNTGGGRVGVAQSIAWMFESLGLRLIGLTAALDNVRSARAIDGAGFKRMGERDSVRPDGTVRRSLYWELTRDEWRRMHRL